MCAVRKSSKGLTTDALGYIRKIEDSSELRPYEIVLKGTILLRQRNMSSAKEALLQAVDMIGKPSSDNSRYTLLYSTALLHGMHGNLLDEKRDLDEARDIPCSSLLKRWLPLYDIANWGGAKPEQ